MAAPTFVGERETAFNTSTSPKTTATFDAALNDVLIGCVGEENLTTSDDFTYSNTQGALTWTEGTEVGAQNADCFVQIARAISDGAKTGMTVSATRAGGTSSEFYGLNVLQFSGSDGVGAVADSATAQSVSITTTQDNSAVVLLVADWSAGDWGATRPWLDINGQDTLEQTYFRDSTRYTVGVAYCPDVGAAGAKTVGLTGLSGTFVVTVVEVKGTVGAPASARTPIHPNNAAALSRASLY